MVARVTSSTQFQAVMQRMPLPKITKVALGALALFALCLSAAFVYRRWQAPTYTIPKCITDIVNGIPPKLIELLGGQEKFDQYPIRYYPQELIEGSTFKADTSPAAQHMDVFENLKGKVPNVSEFIFKGVDKWGHPFVVMRFKKKSSAGTLQAIFYQFNNVWYFQNGKLFDSLGGLAIPSKNQELIKKLACGEEYNNYYPLTSTNL